MTARFHDGFEHLATGQSAGTVENMLSAAGWYIRRDFGSGGTPSVGSPGAYGFGNFLALTGDVGVGGNSYHVVRPIDAEGGFTAGTGFIGVDVFYPASNITSALWIGFYDGVNDAPQVTVQFCPNGVLRAWRGYPGGAFLGVSKIGAYLVDTWFRLELGTFIDASAGFFQVRVNTVPVIALLSANTKNTAASVFDSIAAGSVGQGGVNISFWLYLDNVSVNDNQGSVNNTYLGKVRVKSGLMVAAGSSTMFTPVGAGANYQAVQNLLRDDTKYVVDGTNGDFDLYAPNPNLGSQPVRALQFRASVRQDDATQRIYRNKWKFGSTAVTGRDHYTNQTYSDWLDMIELNPATGLGLVGTDVNGSQMGPMVEA